jgi:hypothetical protein
VYKFLLSVLTFIVLFPSFFSNTAYSQSYLNFPIDTLVKDEYFNYRCMTKFDAAGKIHMVNSRQLGTNSATREIFYRNNVSGNFVTTRITNNSVDDNYATMGFDAQGFLHIGWERRDPGIFQLIYANNRGGNFNDTVWITTGGVNKATPFMAVGKGDSLVHFVYYTFTTGNNNAYYRNYNYITRVLGPEVFLSAAMTGSENDIEVAVDNNNKIHIIYATNLNPSALRYWTNESGTLTEMSTGVPTNCEYPDITIDNSNVLHIVYRHGVDHRLYVLRRTTGGGAFAAPIAITPSGIGNPAYWRTIDTDDNNRLYVTYQNSVASAPRGFFLVHGVGTNFVNPILIFEDSTSSYSTRGNSSIAARGNGEIAISFEPAGSRNGQVISDIFMKRGILNLVNIEPISQVAEGYELSQNYPNPFNPTTNFEFKIQNSGFVKLTVYDINGKEISVLLNQQMSAGTYQATFDGSSLASGTYFYKIETEKFSETKKMLMIK